MKKSNTVWQKIQTILSKKILISIPTLFLFITPDILLWSALHNSWFEEKKEIMRLFWLFTGLKIFFLFLYIIFYRYVAKNNQKKL